MQNSQHSPEELARDASESRRLLDNAQVCLWDIDKDELTTRESRRLSTIHDKIDELSEIIEERELSEY